MIVSDTIPVCTSGHSWKENHGGELSVVCSPRTYRLPGELDACQTLGYRVCIPLTDNIALMCCLALGDKIPLQSFVLKITD